MMNFFEIHIEDLLDKTQFGKEYELTGLETKPILFHIVSIPSRAISIAT